MAGASDEDALRTDVCKPSDKVCIRNQTDWSGHHTGVQWSLPWPLTIGVCRAKYGPGVGVFADSTLNTVMLELGTVVYLTGRIFTAREGVYKRAVEDGHGLPASREEMGLAQAIWVLDVEKMGPFLVEGDINGNSLFERENAKVASSIEAAYEGTRPATMQRYGELDDKTKEVI